MSQLDMIEHDLYTTRFVLVGSVLAGSWKLATYILGG